MRAKIINESMFEPGYAEAEWKMDKFMPDDQELQDEYYEILDDPTISNKEKYEKIAEFIKYNVQDEERMYSYFPENGTIEEFAKYLVDNHNK
jgi:hypothetical protein